MHLSRGCCPAVFKPTLIVVVSGVAGTGLLVSPVQSAETVAAWLFDEPRGSYPSSVMDSSAGDDFPLVLGQGGRLVAGKFGNALSMQEQEPIEYPAGRREFGLRPRWQLLPSDDRAMTWENARFAALMTTCQPHLRDEVGFADAVDTRLNLGPFDWTVEFWFAATESVDDGGVVFELAVRSDSEYDRATRLELDAGGSRFLLINGQSDPLKIPTAAVIRREIPHLASLTHLFILRKNSSCTIMWTASCSGCPNHAAYRSFQAIGFPIYRLAETVDGNDRCPGRIDELRFSVGRVYDGEFKLPGRLLPERSPGGT